MKNKKLIIGVVIVIALLSYLMYKPNNVKFNIKDFDIETVKRGDVLKSITANGTINPVNVVQVGTQVSGTIEKIYVDFNSLVEKDQELAKLDTAILEKMLDETQQSVRKARANLDLIISDYNRTLSLYKENFIARVELEQAQTQLRNARADYNIANSKYESAKINLGYAIIKSPVAGVIISREVDVGQTVAASLSAPVLFKVAEDLTKMQIETSISEADIGSIRNGLEVEFSVDSFPNQKFTGIINQVRLNPVSESNVVVYNVIIETKNDDKKLMPGMTAYVNIPIAEAKGVIKINNVALRFRPDDDLAKIMKVKIPSRKEEYSIVYRYDEREQTVTPTYVKRGLSNLQETEITSDELRDGDKIISNSVLLKTKK
ncbi:MAG: efflux RND transporter periplasmic adaptor subunit [Rickettsiales bacterium]|jgi:HlyD family secretion protein|nr:efflux RND transporter periplasmic adaptor subunit [Rickettsiales bacterium]